MCYWKTDFFFDFRFSIFVFLRQWCQSIKYWWVISKFSVFNCWVCFVRTSTSSCNLGTHKQKWHMKLKWQNPSNHLRIELTIRSRNWFNNQIMIKVKIQVCQMKRIQSENEASWSKRQQFRNHFKERGDGLTHSILYSVECHRMKS